MANQRARTCGPLYQEALGSFTDLSNEQVALFASGFVTGQAEKIYLGACLAAMFRPSPSHWSIVNDAVGESCHRYGLNWNILRTSDSEKELWLYHPMAGTLIWRLGNLQVNSEEWHVTRAILCGIPTPNIDRQFHLRKGTGEPCDQVVKEHAHD